MSNAEIATMLRRIAFLIELDSENSEAENTRLNFKSRAYIKASDQIQNLPINIKQLYEEKGIDGLLQIPSIGKAIATKISEFLNTGTVDYYEKLKLRYPIQIDDFLDLEGIGPKTLRRIFSKINIKTLDELEELARNRELRILPGFSANKETDILKKIEMHRIGKKRFLLGDIYPLALKIEEFLVNNEEVSKAAAVGSFRRMKETVGDLDFVVVSNDPKKVIEKFVTMPNVKEILSKGVTKAFVKLNNNMDADLLVVPSESFGTALLYFTGSKRHGIHLRKLAQVKGYRLNEWGLYENNTDQKIAGESESDVYDLLGLEWIPPEMREDNGEIELAKKGSNSWQHKMALLVDYNDVRGDLQVHSNYTDGKLSIEDMAYYARMLFDLDYIAITDHTQSLKIAGGLDEKEILDQQIKIHEINDRIKSSQFFEDMDTSVVKNQFYHYGNNYRSRKKDDKKTDKKFRILSGAEVNILKDGTLDISNNVLDKLDLVGAAIHSNFSLPEEIQTERLIKVAQNPSVDILFHPTGRIINKREGYQINISKVLSACLDTKTVIEIDAHYNRLDIRDELIRTSINNGVNLVIDSDAHHPMHYAFLNLGISQARRGWANKKDILNTQPIPELLSSLK
ncbi:helix-hairpin-helix domain-containing protein [Candidatus Nitrosocosmicus agrestis]|jgi:DNA polymerase (family 10)|uniref:helix-hairpin-helix domain-containing protein n=1 Tax=Candidatus Nitrosocosmicus agrestis TaxID=2563600 RepID=UPI00122E7404|nr:helix-hairpin-helix domain-containing protein [Candidatus Nitrosocosmicus sp. SS]KAA2283026.1 DNA polymerase III [Candidatus Nitrosocosmicus sp. SS]KAF0868486.1 DNA polymerase III [Candidatus Nitrosocosmicus sp. SS]MDR4490132.1 helix-hairpin-helix domain-containing protein [Candidatus Nitrosocosmicus sp.]